MNGIVVLGVIALIVLVLLGLVALSVFMFVMAWKQNNALVKHGVITEAEVVSRRKVYGGPISKNRSMHYYITYRYEVTAADGKKSVYTHEENVWGSVYDKNPEGSHFNVRYLPERPEAVQRSTTLVGA